MNPPIAGQLRMKGGGENVALADQNRVVTPAPEHLYRRFSPYDSGGADKDPLHPWRSTEFGREVDLSDR